MQDATDPSPQRKAGIVRGALRAALASTRWFLPTRPTLRQIRVGNLQVLAWINDHIGRRLLLAHSYEPEDIAALQHLVRPGDTVADVGANIGYLALHMATFAGKGGRVYAFEPMAHLHPVAALNAWLNGLTTISVHPLVVSDTSDALAHAVLPEGGAPFAYFKASNDGVGVRMVRLDDFATQAGIQRFDVFKIDVEGGEVGVLKGATSLLADPLRRPRVLMIEIVDAQLQRFGQRLEDVYAILTPLGYRASIYRGGAFESVTEPRSADRWNVFFSLDPMPAPRDAMIRAGA